MVEIFVLLDDKRSQSVKESVNRNEPDPSVNSKESRIAMYVNKLRTYMYMYMYICLFTCRSKDPSKWPPKLK